MGIAPTAIDWQRLVDFTPKQKEAAAAVYSHRYILYGGARGGGKSRFLRWMLIEYLISLYVDYGIKNARVMLACETYPDLRDRQISKIKIEIPSWIGTLKNTQEDGFSFTLDDNLGGGVIALRNLDNPTKYQSAEFASIAVDELTKVQKEVFDILRGSLRWPGVSHTVFLGATNPGGIGHAWVKALWIDGVFPPELVSKADQFKFIQSLPADNPHLPETYWEELNSLPDNLRRAWVYGDWSVFVGMAFPAWSDGVHITDTQPEEIPAHWPRVVGIDWGFAKPFAAAWIAKDPDTGRNLVYREAYATGLTDQQQARLIREYSAGETIRRYFADPSMWAKKTQTVITSTADIYRQEGIVLTPGDNDRLAGKRKLDRLLQNLPDGRPGLQVSRNCKNVIRTVPLLAYDQYRPEDVDTDQEDHLYDAIKYGLTDEKTAPTILQPKPARRSAWQRGSL